MHDEKPLSGPFDDIMKLVAKGALDKALTAAWKWREDAPGDVLAVIALGESLEAKGDVLLAARAYGSIIDLFPSRADLRRMAGQRLERLGDAGLPLALDTYEQSVKQRPDHPSSHRLYGLVLLKSHKYEQALAAIEAGYRRHYPAGRFAGVKKILADDLALILAVWQSVDEAAKKAAAEAAHRLGLSAAATPSTRFVLHWETDANDVDLHVYDGFGGHAFYSSQHLTSGGSLYADVTTGYGPECFAIQGKPTGFPYTFQTHYYSKGPMGYGMGTLQIIEHDGKGKLAMSHRPFVVMNDNAYAGLGTYEKPLI
jgi:tetratricopeptide (TPR) repeat protein